MSFDSNLVLFLISQEHNGYLKLFFFFFIDIIVWSQHNSGSSDFIWYQLSWVVQMVKKTVRGLKVIVGKGHPSCQCPLAVSFPQYGRGHDSESADWFHTNLHVSTFFSSNYCQKKKILYLIAVVFGHINWHQSSSTISRAAIFSEIHFGKCQKQGQSSWTWGPTKEMGKEL